MVSQQTTATALLGNIPRLVDDYVNSPLNHKIKAKEIKEAIFEMGGSKAPSLDGFLGCCFQSFWEILTKDIVATIQDFQVMKIMTKDVNSTFLALIPKDLDAFSFGKFHPISLCNFIYKIIAKVLANKIKVILPRIISPN